MNGPMMGAYIPGDCGQDRMPSPIIPNSTKPEPNKDLHHAKPALG
uniref:Uncharacterized protein n=1 Tax=Candidatus Kentrum sp. LPFa TaxID=2126335 RepID=A0A450W512_9GAMM|nr:MAG: hypothetical protein BECKLPF1236A_GA0070988_1006615 [Candidatus Kentron sp. LPFa]VFK28164.1 MAG: hypothetical protein BECKLPF1236C_GA0070990_100607 [Candidatus Kentron sp. LPFa]